MLLVIFRLHVHLRVESAGVLTIKIFRERMFDFKRIIHQTKPIRDPRSVTWFEFSFQKYVIYPGPGGSAKYGNRWKGRKNILSHFLRVNVTRCKLPLSKRN